MKLKLMKLKLKNRALKTVNGAFTMPPQGLLTGLALAAALSLSTALVPQAKAD